jgi:hypothetical protein
MYQTMGYTSLERLQTEMTTLMEEAAVEWVPKSA